jgi:hypothetical protein
MSVEAQEMVKLEDRESSPVGRWAGTVIPNPEIVENEREYEIIVFHEHDHEPGFVPEDFVMVVLSSHFRELHTVRLSDDDALRLAFLLQRATGWALDMNPPALIDLEKADGEE